MKPASVSNYFIQLSNMQILARLLIHPGETQKVEQNKEKNEEKQSKKA